MAVVDNDNLRLIDKTLAAAAGRASDTSGMARAPAIVV